MSLYYSISHNFHGYPMISINNDFKVHSWFSIYPNIVYFCDWRVVHCVYMQTFCSFTCWLALEWFSPFGFRVVKFGFSYHSLIVSFEFRNCGLSVFSFKILLAIWVPLSFCMSLNMFFTLWKSYLNFRKNCIESVDDWAILLSEIFCISFHEHEMSANDFFKAIDSSYLVYLLGLIKQHIFVCFF